MNAYRVVVVGLGKRGLHHATFFKANPRFVLIGISSRDPTRLQNALNKLGNVPASGDVRSLALSARPDIFCFCTPPNVRLDMLKLGIECGAKLIALFFLPFTTESWTTLTPLPAFVPPSQSPPEGSAMRSPSILKPPEGTATGATPPGGGTANAPKLKSKASAKVPPKLC